MSVKKLKKKTEMSNALRFLVGLGLFFISIALIGGFIWIAFPVLIAGSLVLGIIILIALGLISLISLLSAIWYLSRKEPPLVDTSKKASNNYSSSQMKSK